MDNQNEKELKGDRKEYFKTYKRNLYKDEEKRQVIKDKQKMYYHKKVYNMSSEDIKKYDIYLPLIAKIKKNIDELNSEKPEFVREILLDYLN